MRLTLILILALLLLSAGVVSPFGAHPVAAKERHACCASPAGGGGCDRTSKPMPCCKIRPLPAPTADLPPSPSRAEAPAQAYLDLFSQTSFPAILQPAGLAFVHPHDLAALSDPPRLYRLHSAYLI